MGKTSARRSLASCAAGACVGVESKFVVDFSGKFGKNCKNLGNLMEIWKNKENYVEKPVLQWVCKISAVLRFLTYGVR